MQVSCLPIARATSVAATAESTPPDSAHSTPASPTCARIFSIASSTQESIRHVGAIPAIVCRKFCRIAVPASVCTTSGWNSVAYTRRASSLIAATAELAVCASAVKPGGTAVTESPCDIHTRDSGGTPRNSGESARSTRELRRAELAVSQPQQPAAEALHQQLHPIADPQQRQRRW